MTTDLNKPMKLTALDLMEINSRHHFIQYTLERLKKRYGDPAVWRHLNWVRRAAWNRFYRVRYK